MEIVDHAIKDAQKYEQYVFTKMYASGYLTWAAIGFIGSFLSFLLFIFGEPLSVDDDYIGAATGALWLFIVAYGLLSSFKITPLEKSRLSNEEEYQSISKKIGIGWMIAFPLMFVISFSIENTIGFDNPDYTPILLAVGFSLAFGNLWTHLFVKDNTNTALFIGLSILIFSCLIIIIPMPYLILYFGISISIPYYLVGCYYESKLSDILKEAK